MRNRNNLFGVLVGLTTITHATAHNSQPMATAEPPVVEPALPVPFLELVLPILLIIFLVVMLTFLVRLFFEFRLKSKLINRGTPELLAAYLSGKTDRDKHDEAMKWAMLCCGIGLGLLLTYLTAPIHIHSLAIMTFSVGLSYLAYFFYLRR